MSKNDLFKKICRKHAAEDLYDGKKMRMLENGDERDPWQPQAAYCGWGVSYVEEAERGDIWGVESLNEHMIFNQREVVNCITFEPIRGGHWPAGLL